MEYRRSSLVVNQQQLANARANSHAYASFAGAGSDRNAIGLTDALTMWWDDERIEATVNRQFVTAKLRSDEQDKLDEVVRFGDGLTDDTYMEWIKQKAKKIFLILNDLGVPDQIFGVIDDSWDDDDLPIPLEQVERLQLTYDKDEKIEKKFFQRQFYYLLKFIQHGEHMSYDDMELIPLELAESRSTTTLLRSSQHVTDKVHLPGKPDDMFIRRRVQLGSESGQVPKEDFLSCVEALKAVQHEHCTNLSASYTHNGNGYLLLTPAEETNLKMVLGAIPLSIKILPKQDRRALLMNWLHCLAEGLAHLHGTGLAHASVTPSNILLDVEHNVFFSPSKLCSHLTTGAEKRKVADEIYEYSAPEAARQPSKPPSSNTNLERRPSLATSVARRSLTLFITTTSSSSSSNSTSSNPSPIPPISNPSISRNNSTRFPLNSYPTSAYDPLKSDIFSLATIYLEILTLLLKRTTRSFSSHRSAYSKTLNGSSETAFHATVPALQTWMAMLAKDAAKKDDPLFRGVEEILELVGRMLSLEPEERPAATVVRDQIGRILRQRCGLEGKLHCGNGSVEAIERGLEQARLDDQRKAAEACELVKGRLGEGVERRDLALGNGGVIEGVEGRRIVVREPRKEEDRGAGSRERGTKAGKEEKERHKGKGEKGKIKGKGNHKSGRGKEEGDRTEKKKAKAKAWQAPVYAGERLLFSDKNLGETTDVQIELSFG